MNGDTPLHLNGEWRPSSDGAWIEVENPATQEIIGRVAHASDEDIEQAARYAKAGFEVWRNVPAIERGQILRRAGEILRERVEPIAKLLTTEQGKPLEQARIEVTASADIFDFFAEDARRGYGSIIPARKSHVQQHVYKEPVGPIAAFTPWNFPLTQVARKLAAALAAGCSFVVKPPEETPASPAELIRTFMDADIPDGVLGLLYDSPAEISSTLIAHPNIRKITFTGSTAVGKQLASLAGAHMKRTTMELGGHAPVIICDDANIEIAVQQMAAHKFRNAGQVFISPTRFLVQNSIYDEFVERFTHEVEQSIQVGNGADERTTMGPLANRRRVDAVSLLIADAVDKGAKITIGGAKLNNRGYFFEPTVLKDVTVGMHAMNEEPFGPVALFSPFNDLDDALVEANRLPYGLASYGYTHSLARAAKISKNINCEMLSLNHIGLALPETPFGGVGDSGYGSEGGTEAMESYYETKFVTQLVV